MTLDGSVEAISGTFAFDADTASETSVNITLTGTYLTQSFTDATGCANFDTATAVCAYDPVDTTGLLLIDFAASLALGAPDTIVSDDGSHIVTETTTCCASTLASAESGSADPVPEPASPMLFGAALAPLAAARRRKRKAV
jgi:hypothetical protein